MQEKARLNVFLTWLLGIQ